MYLLQRNYVCICENGLPGRSRDEVVSKTVENGSQPNQYRYHVTIESASDDTPANEPADESTTDEPAPETADVHGRN